jgi:ferredoxin-like protein FixX
LCSTSMVVWTLMVAVDSDGCLETGRCMKRCVDRLGWLTVDVDGCFDCGWLC